MSTIQPELEPSNETPINNETTTEVAHGHSDKVNNFEQENESVQNGSVHIGAHQRSTRVRTQTERGLQYQIDTCTRRLSMSKKKLYRQIDLLAKA